MKTTIDSIFGMNNGYLQQQLYRDQKNQRGIDTERGKFRIINFALDFIESFVYVHRYSKRFTETEEQRTKSRRKEEEDHQ